MLKKFFLFSFLILFSSEAAEVNYKVEIAHLLVYVKNTSCKYIRNGEAHDGVAAAQHIKKKYDYYKDDIHTAEEFIRFSATKSTVSDSKYFIECSGSAKVESAQWLLAELDRYRKKEKR